MVNLLLAGRLLPKSLFVLHQHGAENPLMRATYPWARNRVLVAAYDRLLRATHRRCDRIVVIDDVSKRKNEAWGIGDRLIFLPNAVDVTRYQPREGPLASVRARWGLPEDGQVFLHAGRLEKIKRQDVIISAFERWASDGATSGTLVLAGEGTLAERIQRQVSESAVRSRIHFLGFVPPDRMASLMQAADCFVLASEAEGVPMVLLESLACGVPFVAPAIGGIPDLAGDSRGILTPPCPTADVLATAMRAACSKVWDPAEIRQYSLKHGAQAAVDALEQEFAELCLGRSDGR
jgi:glycosyltransferase involved in cell wall biosynthesis